MTIEDEIHKLRIDLEVFKGILIERQQLYDERFAVAKEKVETAFAASEKAIARAEEAKKLTTERNQRLIATAVAIAGVLVAMALYIKN